MVSDFSLKYDLQRHLAKFLTKAKTSCDDKMLFMSIIPMDLKRKKRKRDFSEIARDNTSQLIDDQNK